MISAPSLTEKSTANNLAFLIRETAEEYHAKSKDHLSSHQLGDFRKCPLLYRKKKLGLVADEDRPAYQIGRALHTLVLEGRDRFEAEYAVGGPIRSRPRSRRPRPTSPSWESRCGAITISAWPCRTRALGD